MYQYLIKTSLLPIVILICGVGQIQAEEFRIENRVFVEGQKEPDSHSLTLFHDGIVYDFMSEPSEVTIFDKKTSRFTLLNMANHEQTELSAAEVNTFTEKLRQLANKQKDPLSKFFADPKFEERFEASTGELTLTSPLVVYRVATEVPKSPAVSPQYREFSDWYTRLNSMLNPGSRPPLARLQVNEALARHQVVAREVNFTMTSIKNNAPQKISLRSEHDFTQNLLDSDLERIQHARDAKSKFKTISYDQYGKNRKSER